MSEGVSREFTPIESSLFHIALQELARQQERFGTRLIIPADIDDTTFSHRKPAANTEHYTTNLKDRFIPDARVTGIHLRQAVIYINSGMIRGVPDILSVRNGTMIYTASPDAYEKVNTGKPVDESDFIEDAEYSRSIEAKGFDKLGLLGTKAELSDAVRSALNGAWVENQISDRRENLETWGIRTDKNLVIFDIEIPDELNQNEAQTRIKAIATAMYPHLSVALMLAGPAKQSGMKGNAYGLNILPQGVGKHTANERIIQATGATSICVIGDALNDLSMLRSAYPVTTYRGIVGGAQPPLLNELGLEIHPNEVWLQTQHGLVYLENDSNRVGPESAVQIATDAHEMEINAYQAVHR